jgi:hypothetical protein
LVILAIWKCILQKARTWKRLYYLSWNLTSTYSTLFTGINLVNSVEIAEKLLLRKTRVCGTIKAIRGIPKSLADSSKILKRDDTVVGKGTFFYTSGRIRGRFACVVQYIMTPLERSLTNLEKGRKKANPSNSVQQVHEEC